MFISFFIIFAQNLTKTCEKHDESRFVQQPNFGQNIQQDREKDRHIEFINQRKKGIISFCRVLHLQEFFKIILLKGQSGFLDSNHKLDRLTRKIKHLSSERRHTKKDLLSWSNIKYVCFSR